MSVEENKDLLRRFVKDVLDAKNIAAADNFLSPNFFHHDLAPGEQTGQRTGAAGQKSFFERVVFPAFSNFSTKFEDMVGEDDLVAGRWRQTSLNSGAWLGRRPTGKQTDTAGISIVRIRDGKIVEEWEARDAIGLLRQLGVPVPKPSLPNVVVTTVGDRGTVKPFRTNGPLGGALTAPGAEKLKMLAANVFMDGWNTGDVRVFGRLLSPAFRLHDPTGLQGPGRDGTASLVSGLRTGIPDLNVTVDLQLSEKDLVVSRWTARGTHTGNLLGIAPSKARVAVTGISIHRSDGIQIQEEWSLWEQLSLFQQAGAIRF